MTSRPRTVLIVAGEASGDLHAARLVRALKDADPALEVLAVGGEAMREAGATMLASIDDLAVVGVTEVVQRLPRFWSLLRMLKARLSLGDVDLFIPVDFPDFNFRLARHAHAERVPVFYFIAPQIWAWRRGRLRDMRTWCRHLVVLFPFEVPFFEQAGLRVTHARHPLATGRAPTRNASAIRASLGVGPSDPLIAFLPGSRRSEVSRHMGPLLGAAARLKRRRPGLAVAVGRAPHSRKGGFAPSAGISPS